MAIFCSKERTPFTLGAKRRREEEARAEVGFGLGTIGFMSRSEDLWILGLISYELLQREDRDISFANAFDSLSMLSLSLRSSTLSLLLEPSPR